MVPGAAVAVIVGLPVQVVTTPFGVATTRFAGSVSVKLPLIGTTFPFVMVKVMVLTVVPVPAVVWMVVGLKLLVIDGGCSTIMPALAVPPLELPSPEVRAV